MIKNKSRYVILELVKYFVKIK